MSATDTLRDIWRHHAWADAEHWRVFEAFPAALADAALFERLHHLFLTQSAWVSAIGDRRLEFVSSKPADFTTAVALKDVAMRNHQALALVATLDESELDRLIDIPWLTDPPLRLSVRQGLTKLQCTATTIAARTRRGSASLAASHRASISLPGFGRVVQQQAGSPGV